MEKQKECCKLCMLIFNLVIMKKFLICILLSGLFLTVSGQYKFTLLVNSQTLSDTDIFLYIFNNNDFEPVRIDTIRLKNGHYSLQGEVMQPCNFAEFSVRYNGKDIYRRFVLDAGINNVSLNLPRPLSRFLAFQSDARGHFIFNDLNDLFEETIACYKTPARVNGMLNLNAEQFGQINLSQLKRLEAYPDDFGSLINLYRMTRTDANPSSAKNYLVTFAKFSDELKNSELGQRLYAEETALINSKFSASAGNVVKTFTVTDIHNQSFSNSSLKGQPYIIVFSATWCGPCQQQLPGLKTLYEKYRSKGLKVVYFNDDDNVTKWKDHVAKNKLTWINVSEQMKPNVSKIAKSFGVYAIPACLVIDKMGKIVYNSDQSDVELTDIESYIKEVLIN